MPNPSSERFLAAAIPIDISFFSQGLNRFARYLCIHATTTPFDLTKNLSLIFSIFSTTAGREPELGIRHVNQSLMAFRDFSRKITLRSHFLVLIFP